MITRKPARTIMAKNTEGISKSRFGAHPELKTFRRDPRDFL